MDSESIGIGLGCLSTIVLYGVGFVVILRQIKNDTARIRINPARDISFAILTWIALSWLWTKIVELIFLIVVSIF